MACAGLPTYVLGGRRPLPWRPAGPLPPGQSQPRPNASTLSRPSRSAASTPCMWIRAVLRELTQDVQIAGGRIAVRRFNTREETRRAAGAADLQLHWAGLACVVRGHRAHACARGNWRLLLPQARRSRYAFTGEAGYMFPRADGILLGGHVRTRRVGCPAAAGRHRADRCRPPAAVRGLALCLNAPESRHIYIP
jgi:hypothetical protein